MNELTNTIQEIHKLFCVSTGVELRIGIGEYNRERAWAEFLKQGFNSNDLVTVVNYLKKKIKEGDRNPGALRFSNLIERLELFEETLGMAKAEQRNAPKPFVARERVLEQARPTAGSTHHLQPVTAKPIGAWIEELRRAAQ